MCVRGCVGGWVGEVRKFVGVLINGISKAGTFWKRVSCPAIDVFALFFFMLDRGSIKCSLAGRWVRDWLSAFGQ